VAKYTAQNNSKFEGSSMPARKSHSKERITRTPAVVERTQALILDNPGQSLRVLIDVMKLWMEIVASERPYIFQQDGALTHTSHLIQNWLSDNVVFVQGILASQQRFKSLELLRMERS